MHSVNVLGAAQTNRHVNAASRAVGFIEPPYILK
jgi:hypothetical protein